MPLLFDHRLCASGFIQSAVPMGLGGGQGHVARAEGRGRWVTVSFRRVYQFSRAAVRNYHQQQTCSLELWRLEVQCQDASKAMFSPEGSGEESVPGLSPSFRWWLAILGVPWLVAASLQALPPSSRGLLPSVPSVSVSSPLFPLRMPAIWD